MLAVVEDEQGPSPSEVLEQCLLDGEVLALLHVDSGRDRRDGRARVVDRREQRHEHLPVELVPEIAGEPERQSRLPHASGSGKCQQSTGTQVVTELAELVGSSHQLRALGG